MPTNRRRRGVHCRRIDPAALTAADIMAMICDDHDLPARFGFATLEEYQAWAKQNAARIAARRQEIWAPFEPKDRKAK